MYETSARVGHVVPQVERSSSHAHQLGHHRQKGAQLLLFSCPFFLTFSIKPITDFYSHDWVIDHFILKWVGPLVADREVYFSEWHHVWTDGRPGPDQHSGASVVVRNKLAFVPASFCRRSLRKERISDRLSREETCEKTQKRNKPAR